MKRWLALLGYEGQRGQGISREELNSDWFNIFDLHSDRKGHLSYMELTADHLISGYQRRLYPYVWLLDPFQLDPNNRFSVLKLVSANPVSNWQIPIKQNLIVFLSYYKSIDLLIRGQISKTELLIFFLSSATTTLHHTVERCRCLEAYLALAVALYNVPEGFQVKDLHYL